MKIDLQPYHYLELKIAIKESGNPDFEISRSVSSGDTEYVVNKFKELLEDLKLYYENHTNLRNR